MNGRKKGKTCRGVRQGNTLVSPLQMTLPSITLPYSPPHPFQVPLFLLFSVCSFQGFLGVEGFGLARWGYGRVCPPPFGSHGEGCFGARGTAGGLCVLDVGFLRFPVFFLFTPHPPAGPFPTPGPCVFTPLSSCLFLSHFLSLSGSLSGHCLWCCCLP